MSLAADIDRDGPDVRATLAVRAFERRQRASRVARALALLALAVLAPVLAGPVPGEPATVGAVLASP